MSTFSYIQTKSTEGRSTQRNKRTPPHPETSQIDGKETNQPLQFQVFSFEISAQDSSQHKSSGAGITCSQHFAIHESGKVQSGRTNGARNCRWPCRVSSIALIKR